MIYFDNASTTKTCETAMENLKEFSTRSFYNASSIYKQGIENKKNIDECKKLIAKMLNVKFQDNIIFTGSATEANNLAILGSYRKNFGKMLFSSGEHACVYNSAISLKNKGVNVEFVKLTQDGQIDLQDFKNKLTPDTSFISVMHVNNETGVINPIEELIKLKNQICPKALFHSDGVQAFGKIKTNIEGIDFYTISAHKIHGPKGIGALYIKDKTKLSPMIFGGGQEYNLRSGTENVPAIMGFKGAIEEINLNNTVEKTNKVFLDNLSSEFKINGQNRTPYILSLSNPMVNGETLVHMLEAEDILISRGSACSGSKVGNRVLDAMGLDKKLITGSIRVSFSRYNTEEEAIKVAKMLNQKLDILKNI